MLRSNLSTRPFYNERAVTLALGAASLLVLVLTLFNIVQLASITTRRSALHAEAEGAERRARELRLQASQKRAGVDEARLAAVAAAAREANTLIDGRVFSWTELFNRFEATLPPTVRIASVRRNVDSAGRLMLTIAVVAEDVEDVDAFIEALEGTRAFEEVLSREERVTDEGLLEATLRGIYRSAPPAPAPAEEVSP